MPVHEDSCQVIGGQIPPILWPCQQQYCKQSLEPQQAACDRCNLHGEYPRTFDHMELTPAMTDDGIQPAAKKPVSPLPHTWLRSRTPSTAHGCTRMNMPQEKHAPTTARDPSKPPTSILEILQSKPPAPVKGSRTPPLPTTAAPPPTFATIAAQPPSQKNKAFPH
jgi:hypothetical protein